jgi:hypothetical protein
MPAYQRRENHGSSSTQHHSAASVDALTGILDKASLGSPPITRITIPTPVSPNGIHNFAGASEDTTPEMVRSSRSSNSQSLAHQQQQIYSHQNHHLSVSNGAGGSSVTHDIVYEFDDDVPEVDTGNSHSLDELWGSLRSQKEKKMSREKCKVESLETRTKSPPTNGTHDQRSMSGKGLNGLPVMEMPLEDAEPLQQSQPVASPPPQPPLPSAEQLSEHPQVRSPDMPGAQRRKTVQRQKSVYVEFPQYPRFFLTKDLITDSCLPCLLQHVFSGKS